MAGYLKHYLTPSKVYDTGRHIQLSVLLEISHGSIEYKWEKVRELGVNFLNEIRVDIGIDKNPIEYRGRL